jgi:hypothetical protein
MPTLDELRRGQVPLAEATDYELAVELAKRLMTKHTSLTTLLLEEKSVQIDHDDFGLRFYFDEQGNFDKNDYLFTRGEKYSDE